MTVSGTQDTTSSPPGMRFCVDAWDVSYGTALAVADEDLPASVARVETDVETPADQWAPIPAGSDVPHPSAVLFVDGVRRIDARVWIDDSPAPSAEECAPGGRHGGDRVYGGVRVLRRRRRLLLRTAQATAGSPCCRRDPPGPVHHRRACH